MTKDEIEALYAQGLTYQEIGNQAGVSKQRVHQILTGYRSPPKPYEYRRGPYASPEEARARLDKIIALDKAGWTLKDIAKAVGVTPTYVWMLKNDYYNGG